MRAQRWVTVGLSMALGWGGARANGAEPDGVPPGVITFQLPLAAPPAVTDRGLDSTLHLGRQAPLPVPPLPPPMAAASAAKRVPPPPGGGRAPAIADPWAGGSDSWVARAIGYAEGTRTLQGDRTAAYQGHVDPGNGAWNLGSFSYQHGADSPAAADAQQLLRLQGQDQQLRQQAAARLGRPLTLAEQLNGLDLANQAPTTALTHYIQRLHQAHDLGLTGAEAILWARTRSFLDPNSGRWNAPGLGNTLEGVTRDQRRRQAAIAQVLAASGEPAIATSPAESSPTAGPAIADYRITLDLPIAPEGPDP